MVEALVEHRLTMINQSGPAPLPGELLSLGAGGQVEIYRRTTKDRPSWVGPATVRHADIEHNKVTVTWQSRSLEVPLSSIRRATLFATCHFDTPMQLFPEQEHSTIQILRDALEYIHTLSILSGWIRHHDVWNTMRETRAHWNVFVALFYVAEIWGGPTTWTSTFYDKEEEMEEHHQERMTSMARAHASNPFIAMVTQLTYLCLEATRTQI